LLNSFAEFISENVSDYKCQIIRAKEIVHDLNQRDKLLFSLCHFIVIDIIDINLHTFLHLWTKQPVLLNDCFKIQILKSISENKKRRPSYTK